ncbi:hypothetical protein AB0I23_38735, partial [Streptomyces atratus]
PPDEFEANEGECQESKHLRWHVVHRRESQEPRTPAARHAAPAVAESSPTGAVRRREHHHPAPQTPQGR